MGTHSWLDRTQDALTVRRVFGEPIEIRGKTLVPAAIIRGAGGDGERGGGGFRVHARPIGVIVVSDDDVAWKPAVDVNRIISGGQLVGAIALLTLGPALAAWIRSRLAA